jgi:hypothetical protein
MAEKLQQPEDMDDFSDRNAVQAITVDGKVLFFGG